MKIIKSPFMLHSFQIMKKGFLFQYNFGKIEAAKE
jgi:hypothetical protein